MRKPLPERWSFKDLLATLTSPEKLEALDKWQKEQDDLTIAKGQVFCGDTSQPYYGAIGGELTYSFSPTSLGTICTVKHSNGAEIDLTDFDSW